MEKLMSRLVIIFTLLFTVISAQQNEESYPFIGMSISSQTIDILENDKTHEVGFGLRYGQQTQDWRTTFNLDYTQNSYTNFSISIDKILMDNMFGTPKLRPYLGATVGYLNYDIDNLTIDVDESNGFYGGGNFGFIIYTTDSVDIDLNYHYYKVQNLDFLDDIHGASLSLHYFF